MNQLNEDIVRIDQALKRLSTISETIGYANCSKEVIRNNMVLAANDDDAEAYSNGLERMEESIEDYEHEREKAVQDVKDAFDHYYS